MTTYTILDNDLYVQDYENQETFLLVHGEDNDVAQLELYLLVENDDTVYTSENGEVAVCTGLDFVQSVGPHIREEYEAMVAQYA